MPSILFQKLPWSHRLRSLEFRRAFRCGAFAALSAFVLCALPPGSAFARDFAKFPTVADCPPPRWMSERLDFYNPTDQVRVRQIESHHFDADTEALIRGKTAATPGGDIEFLVRYIPNHPRGLSALVRLSLRDRTPRPSGVQVNVECYLVRALEFRAGDVLVEQIYGTYLARLGRNEEAVKRFKNAESIAPEDALIAYNLGLLYVELGDFEQARRYAQKAYSSGISFPGLRDRLARAGELRE